jgi:hypothetical protein
MSTPQTVQTATKYARAIYSNWRYSQPILISTAFQKRMKAVERRIIIEDVV